MEVDISFAPGAEESPLARWVGDTIRTRLEGQPSRQRDFFALRAAVVMAAPDRRMSVTLRFDHGQLTIHDGTVGIPDVTFCGDYPALLSLTELKVSSGGRVPLLFGESAGAWRRTFSDVLGGELKIYGLWSRLPTVLSFLRVVSRRS